MFYGKYLTDIDKIEFLLKPSLSKNNSLQYKLLFQNLEELPKAIKYKDGTSLKLKYKPINLKYNKGNKIIFKKYDRV